MTSSIERLRAEGKRANPLWVALWVLLLGLTLARENVAQPKPPAPEKPAPVAPGAPAADHRCAAASALEGLDANDREAVAALCRGENRNPDELSRLLNALAGSPRWQTTLYLSLVAKRLPPARSIESLTAPPTAGLAQLVAKPACPLRAALEKDAADRGQRNAVGVPITMERLERCGVRADGRQRVLTIAGANDDQITLALFGAGPPQALRMVDSHEIASIRYFVAVLPAGARVLVLHQAANTDEPAQVYDVTMATDAVNQPQEAGRRYCVEVQVKASSETLVLLDAQLLSRTLGWRSSDEHSYWVRAQVEFADHQLNVLRSDGGELARLPILKTELSPSQCATYRLDLTDRKDVAFTIAVDEACSTAGVVPARARMFLKALLEEQHGLVVKDLEAWGEVFRTVHGLQQNIGVFGVQAAGVARGSLDSFESLKLAAGELTREGFNEAFVSKLSCSTDSGQWTSTFTVYRLKVAELRNQAKGTQHSDITRAIVPEYETVTSLDDLRDLIAAPIARLHGRGYVRWITDRSEFRLYASPGVLADIRLPEKARATVKTAVYDLEPAQASSYCSTVRRKRRLVLLEKLDPPPLGPESSPFRSLEEFAFDAGSVAGERFVKLPGLRRGGTYVVEAALVVTTPASEGGASETLRTRTFTCVDITDSGTHVWGLFDASFWSHGSRNQRDSISTLLGMSFGPTGESALWTVVGLSATFLSANVPPSWDDVATFRNYDVDGEGELTWQRRSLLLGAGMQYEVVYARGHAFVLRWAALLDIGDIATDTVPDGLPTFLEKRSPGDNIIDIDLSALAHAGFRFQVGERLQAQVLAGCWVRGFDDPLFDDPASIRRDGGLSFSAALGLGYDL